MKNHWIDNHNLLKGVNRINSNIMNKIDDAEPTSFDKPGAYNRILFNAGTPQYIIPINKNKMYTLFL